MINFYMGLVHYIGKLYTVNTYRDLHKNSDAIKKLNNIY